MNTVIALRPARVGVRADVDVPIDGAVNRTRFVTFDGLSAAHFAIRFGQPGSTPLVRLHSECVTGDVFGSQRCDCGSQLQTAVRLLDRDGGWLLYLRQEGRGIGLIGKMDAYLLQQQRGIDTYSANRQLGFAEDARDYTDAVKMLEALDISELHLLSGNSEKAVALSRLGVSVRSIRMCPGIETQHSASYLSSKRERGHLC